MKKHLVILLIIFLQTPIFAQTDYQIGPDDVLEITVYEEEDLSREVRVSSDGSIAYPLLGRFEVNGLTIRQLEEKLTVLLEKDYLVNPQVTVFIKEYSNIYIMGEVQKPGSYKLSPHTTLMTALAMAGGLTEFSNKDKIQIVRQENGQKKIVEISLNEVSDQGFKDILLRSNDVVQVKRYENIYVLGQVEKPGEFVLKGQLTVVEAISLAGGFTKIAAPNKTRIMRTEKGVQLVIEIPVADILKTGDKTQDVLLKPNDMVIVPESFF